MFQGVTAGLIAGVALVGGMTVGSQVASESGQTLFKTLPTSIEGCDNATIAMSSFPVAAAAVR
jgi:hypothetical protein